MNQLPFSVYDFFGYLAAGVVLIAGITVAFVGYGPVQETPSLPAGVLLVILAYITGHVVANVAGHLIESRLVAGKLGRPTEILLGESIVPELAWRFLPGYRSPLEAETQERIRAGASGLHGAALFYHCFAMMKQDEVVRERLATFLNLYGFCRNMALALCLVTVCLATGIVLGTADTGQVVGPGWWLAAAPLAALGMFYRYLKFYRQYALELLTSFAATEVSS